MPHNPIGSPAIHICSYEPADHDAVLRLAPRLVIGIAPWRDPEGMLAAAQRWIEGSIEGRGSNRAVLVAKDSQANVIGFVSAARDTNFTGELQAYVGELVVDEHAEGQGVGRLLMEAVENWARAQGYHLVVLPTSR
ncbi:MAG: GNAT family N-acetyltransferase [Herpetosiphonaceae bacterium]|nr:GNAT family N-acetyltransferase [Herpetosiphonaceae bacterium]